MIAVSEDVFNFNARCTGNTKLTNLFLTNLLTLAQNSVISNGKDGHASLPPARVRYAKKSVPYSFRQTNSGINFTACAPQLKTASLTASFFQSILLLGTVTAQSTMTVLGLGLHDHFGRGEEPASKAFSPVATLLGMTIHHFFFHQKCSQVL